METIFLPFRFHSSNIDLSPLPSLLLDLTLIVNYAIIRGIFHFHVVRFECMINEGKDRERERKGGRRNVSLLFIPLEDGASDRNIKRMSRRNECTIIAMVARGRVRARIRRAFVPRNRATDYITHVTNVELSSSVELIHHLCCTRRD